MEKKIFVLGIACILTLSQTLAMGEEIHLSEVEQTKIELPKVEVKNQATMVIS